MPLITNNLKVGPPEKAPVKEHISFGKLVVLSKPTPVEEKLNVLQKSAKVKASAYLKDMS